jgi:hypothetical protein
MKWRRCLQTTGIYRFEPGLLDREQAELQPALTIPALRRRSSCFPAALYPSLRSSQLIPKPWRWKTGHFICYLNRTS